MSTFWELLIERDRVENECFKLSKAAFEKIQNAGIIKNGVEDEEDDEDDEDDVAHAAEGYKFYEDEVTKTGLRLKGYRYAGGGENEYVSIIVPFNQLDNIDLFIEEHKAAWAKKAEAIRAERQAKLEAEKIEQANHDRDTYERLKTQFEGATQ